MEGRGRKEGRRVGFFDTQDFFLGVAIVIEGRN